MSLLYEVLSHGLLECLCDVVKAGFVMRHCPSFACFQIPLQLTSPACCCCLCVWESRHHTRLSRHTHTTVVGVAPLKKKGKGADILGSDTRTQSRWRVAFPRLHSARSTLVKPLSLAGEERRTGILPAEGRGAHGGRAALETRAPVSTASWASFGR